MNTAPTSYIDKTEGISGVTGMSKSHQTVVESVQKRYIGTFELIEDPNSPGTYYDGPY